MFLDSEGKDLGTQIKERGADYAIIATIETTFFDGQGAHAVTRVGQFNPDDSEMPKDGQGVVLYMKGDSTIDHRLLPFEEWPGA